MSEQTVTAREALGRSARKRVPRSTHTYEPVARNFDPIQLIEQQNAARLQELVPIRHARMVESAFAFYRGTASVMAADLAQRPNSGILGQICGDAHLANFGAFASPERALLFDINDFDETLPGPFEWDLKRLVASAVLAGRNNGFSKQDTRAAAFHAAAAYCETIRQYARMGELDVWYSRIVADDLRRLLPRGRWREAYRKGIARAQQRDSLHALARLAEPIGTALRIKDEPPLIRRIDDQEDWRRVAEFIAAYRETLEESRRILLDRYRLVSAAYKAVGVGSVGTRCFVALFMGHDQQDPLFLQVKEANRSVLEAYLPESKYEQHGERVVTGQRMMQAASDVFLGWARGARGFHFYVRQLRDWKASVDLARLDTEVLVIYSLICGRTLARAHARGGDAVAIAAYVGASDRFSEVLTDFAVAYADQAERDHESFRAAIVSGRLPSSKLGIR